MNEYFWSMPIWLKALIILWILNAVLALVAVTFGLNWLWEWIDNKKTRPLPLEDKRAQALEDLLNGKPDIYLSVTDGRETVKLNEPVLIRCEWCRRSPRNCTCPKEPELPKEKATPGQKYQQAVQESDTIAERLEVVRRQHLVGTCSCLDGNKCQWSNLLDVLGI